MVDVALKLLPLTSGRIYPILAPTTRIEVVPGLLQKCSLDWTESNFLHLLPSNTIFNPTKHQTVLKILLLTTLNNNNSSMETESPSRRLSSGPRSSLLSASTASSEKPSRRSSNSTPSPQLSFGLKRRRSKQVEITPLPLDLDAGPVESVVGVESGSRPDTNNPLVHSASSSTIENTNDAEEELEDKEGQSPRKFRKVVGEAQAQTERPAEEGTETFHNQTYREPITPSAQLSNSGKESFSNRTQVSHSRSRSDDTSSRVEGSKMSISNMSSSSAVQLEGPSSSNPASPEGIGGFRPHSNSEAGASRPLPGSQGALTTATSALSESNQNLIHPSLAGLPGTGGGVGSKQQPSFIMKLYS